MNSKLKEVNTKLKEKYNLDVVDDIILAREKRIILFFDNSDKSKILNVVSGNLSILGLPSNESIELNILLKYFDVFNKYGEVRGIYEYKEEMLEKINNLSSELNLTVPLKINHKKFWCRFHFHPVKKNKDIYALFITDVTEYLLDEEKIFEKSHKDSLTSLFNKYTLDYHLEVKSKISNMHILYMDLDDFKNINDTYGHDVGNTYLIKFANILKLFQTYNNSFYRIGGDEFVGLIFEDKSEVLRIADRIITKTNNIHLKDIDIKLGVSIGIHSNKYLNEDILKIADQLMYRAKQSGKNIVIYE
ncbi:hypothetical protein CI105_03595 [Candidatus Izimaplasma bacterium ZiA1]|uniref:GGDEF domain-containing protein n=1 Tax=Candidatus Izimoplasma sp. ZiA1 TaxID=2024899 RepID=UPI000BAA7E34|nr:hypothetical protein CI105_03595 [Candidatus Izimaplasma bacterium ZiA1]